MRVIFALFLLLGLAATANAFENFKVKDIRLEGLQRISIGTVFNYLPIKPGDSISRKDVIKGVRALFKTGFFKDIQFEKEDEVLVIFVAERPAINEINFEGNSKITTEQLENVLKQAGLVKGRVYNRSVLENLQKELQRQYFSLGKYNVKVDIEQTQLERNRIDIVIKIAEGESAEIYSVKITGNKSFEEKELLLELQLADPSFWGSKNNYQKQQLAADLEALKSYYLDRGFLNFTINSTQVSLGPDKESVYISININEGDKYTVRDIKLAGDLILPEKELMSLIDIKVDETFSRRKVVESTQRINAKFAENGYAFANINMVPDIDKDSRSIGLTFFVDPGRRIYVRKVNVSGNSKTRDEVIRRELRQLEGDWLSTKNVSRSKTRLDRLGYFDQVTVDTKKVPGTIDQVDLDYHVIERPTGSLQAGVGYSDSQGVVVNLAVTQDNFLGTGNRIGIQLDNGSVTKQYSVNYTDPYYTETGVSRSLGLSFRQVDAEEAEITNYTTDSYGATMSFGVPLSEFTSYSWGLKYDQTDITVATSGTTSQNILDFIAENGKSNVTHQLFASFAYDTRDRRIFATRGNLSEISTNIAFPGADLEYYKVNLQQTNYFPLGEYVTLAANISLGYGMGTGKTAELPPYENYFVGGVYSVRGYDANSIGPRDSASNDPIGGPVKVVGNLDLILPNPFTAKQTSTRVSVFLDTGGVFNDLGSINNNDFRSSLGVAFVWITPVGAMRFNFSEPINPQPGDSTTGFQFSLGSPF